MNLRCLFGHKWEVTHKGKTEMISTNSRHGGRFRYVGEFTIERCKRCGTERAQESKLNWRGRETESVSVDWVKTLGINWEYVKTEAEKKCDQCSDSKWLGTSISKVPCVKCMSQCRWERLPLSDCTVTIKPESRKAMWRYEVDGKTYYLVQNDPDQDMWWKKETN